MKSIEHRLAEKESELRAVLDEVRVLREEAGEVAAAAEFTEKEEELRARREKVASVEAAQQLSDPVQQRIAALLLAYGQGWSARDIARHFGWRSEDVERFLAVGKALL
jgi:DNA-directed RNA polymerase specialized sigma24 family protein